MAQVHYVVTGSVNDGQLDAFKDVAERLTKAVEANEPDALNYDWHVAGDGSTFAIEERFTDDAAFAAHLANVGELIGELLPLIEIKGTFVLGDVGEESQAALSGFGGIFTSQIVKLNR